jgi:GPH family glycoside/pentoside/hexuronide:cation symporter
MSGCGVKILGETRPGGTGEGNRVVHVIHHRQHHVTAPEDRVPVSQKIGFGIGALVPVIAVNAVGGLTQLFLNVGLKVNPVLVGIVMMLPRLWDGITDPVVGNLSDNTRSRWGRRLPYVFAGAIITGILYTSLWFTPRDWGQVATLAYFLGMSLLFYTAVTVYAVPQQSLGVEMTNDYHERTRIFSFSAFFISLGGIVLPWFYWLANRSIFVDEVEGMKWVGTAVGLGLMLCGIACALICKEGKREQAMQQEKTRFWKSFTTTLQNRAFVWLIAVIVLVSIGFNLVAGFGSYVTIYYIYGGDKTTASSLMGVIGTVWAVTSILGILPMNWLSKRIGKRNTVMLFVAIMGIGNLTKIVCYNPEHPYWVLLPIVMLSAGMLVMYTLGGAMMADICDEEELETGKRREGMYSAAYGWWLKLGIAVAVLVAGVLLQSTGFDAELAVQSERTMFLVRAWEIGLPSALCFISLILLRKCPLSEARAYEVKQLLAERKRQVEA